MRVISTERKAAVINALCNGNSLRATNRLTGVHRTAIQRLLLRVGSNCYQIMEKHMRNIDCKYLELDEIWTFCGKKEGRLTPMEKQNLELGDQYVFYAIDRQTKLIPAWAVGKRTRDTTRRFVGQLRRWLNGNRPQISTDAWSSYPQALQEAFGTEIDYAQIIKIYAQEDSGRGRYAPPKVSEVISKIIFGNPDEDWISTSIIERSNLTLRQMPRSSQGRGRIAYGVL